MSDRLVSYEPEHAYAILDRNVREQNLELSKYPDWEQWAKGWKESGPAYTLFVDDEIICSAGVVLLDWRRGEAWLLVTTSFFTHVKIAYRTISDMLNVIIQNNKLRRVQALVLPDFEKGKNFLRHLGFEEEGLLHAYGPNGEDMTLYWKRGV